MAHDMKKNNLWFHLVIIITIGGFIYLSIWQFQRLHWKEAVIADIQNHWSQAPMELAELEKLQENEWAYHKVILPANTSTPTALKPALTITQNSGFGLKPINLTPDQYWLLLWPWQANGAPQAVYGTPPFVALVKPVQKTAPFAAANHPANGDWYQMDRVMMHHFQPRITTHYLQILTPDELIAPPLLPNNNHLQYAMTWLALALVVTGMYIHLLRQKRN